MTMLDLSEMSDKAIAQLMNALNPGSGQFETQGDRRAFTRLSQEVADRYFKRPGQEASDSPFNPRHVEVGSYTGPSGRRTAKADTELDLLIVEMQDVFDRHYVVDDDARTVLTFVLRLARLAQKR